MAGKTRPSLREKTLQNVALSNLSLTDKQCIQSVFEKFEALSKADVVEVKHGKWEINSDGYYPYCGNCKTEPKNGLMSKYCPECGAKMGGGNAE